MENRVEKYFIRKDLRFWIGSDKILTCQSLLVAAYPKWNGGYQWQ